MTSAERRITLLSCLYPRLKAWAERDNITVADVANAILLQSIQPYGPGAVAAPVLPPGVGMAEQASPLLVGDDPYQTAALDSW